MKNGMPAFPAGLLISVGLWLAGCGDTALEEAPVAVDLTGWMDGGTDDYLNRGSGFGSSSVSQVAVEGRQGMVTGTSGPVATRIGIETLKAGGNAMDAAISTALAQIVVTGGAFISYAGWWTMVYYDAESGRYHSLNAGYNTVRGETDPETIRGIDFAAYEEQEDLARALGELRTDGRAVLVPGFMAGVQAGHDRFGSLPFDALFQPAIRLAENGIPVTSFLANVFSKNREILSIYPETAAIFVDADGEVPAVGDRFRQAALAGTLRKVATEGAAYMYTGPWAEKFVRIVQDAGGKMTMADLRDYSVSWTDPVHGRFGEFEIHAYGLPAIGGVNAVEALQILDAADLGSPSDPHYESGQDLFWLANILDIHSLSNMPDAEREALYEGVDLSLESRVKPATSRWIWERIQASGGNFFKKPQAPADASPKHSAAVVAVDRQGNVAAVVHSINTDGFGYTGMFVDGVSIPDSAWFQKGRIKRTGPGNRVPTPTNPMIVARNGKPYLGSATIGSSLHQQTVQGAYYVLGYGMTPNEAVAQPTAQVHWALDGSISVVPGEFPEQALAEYTALGGRYSTVENRGRFWVSVLLDPDSGRLISSDAVLEQDGQRRPMELAAGY